MAVPVRASLGSVTINAVNVVKVTDYSVKATREVSSVGPWVGDPTIVDIPGGVKTAIDFTCDIPETGDAGQNAVLTAFSAGTHPPLVFTATLGKIFTIASPTYTGYDAKGDAKAGQQFKFTATGDAVITQA